MKRNNVKQFKTYQSLLMFLRRKKIENHGSLAGFLLETYLNAPLEKRDGEYVIIFKHDLERSGVLKNSEKFEDWRELMVKRGILNWKVKPNDNNFVQNKNYFAPSPSLVSYINKEKIYRSSLATVEDLNKLDDKFNDKFNDKADLNRVKSLEENVSVLKGEVSMLKENMNNMATIILKALPPDTPKRRKIISKYQDDPVKCMNELRLDIEKNIQETGRMFKN